MEIRAQLERVNSRYDRWEEELDLIESRIDCLIGKLQSPNLIAEQYDFLCKKYAEMKRGFDAVRATGCCDSSGAEKSHNEIRILLGDMENLIEEMGALTELGTGKYVRALDDLYAKVGSFNR